MSSNDYKFLLYFCSSFFVDEEEQCRPGVHFCEDITVLSRNLLPLNHCVLTFIFVFSFWRQSLDEFITLTNCNFQRSLSAHLLNLSNE